MVAWNKSVAVIIVLAVLQTQALTFYGVQSGPVLPENTSEGSCVLFSVNANGNDGTYIDPNGGDGGMIEIRAGYDVDEGDGRDGIASESMLLEPGEYFFQHIGVPDSITLTVKGEVIIHCQHNFFAEIKADYSLGPPIVTLYMGTPTPMPVQGADGIVRETILLQLISCNLDAPYSEAPLNGGTFIFHTECQDGIVGGIVADGGRGEYGGRGGAGGTIVFDGNDTFFWALVLAARGGEGSSGGPGGSIDMDCTGAIFSNVASVCGGDGREAVGGDGGIIDVNVVGNPAIYQDVNDPNQEEWLCGMFGAVGGDGGTNSFVERNGGTGGIISLKAPRISPIADR